MTYADLFEAFVRRYQDMVFATAVRLVGSRVEAEVADRREQLERAMARLPDRQRVPLVLFHFEELSYQEIGAALGISVAKVKTDIHRGREALKALLSDHATR